MPRFPRFASRTTRISGSVYEKFRARMVAQGSGLVGLHIGDAYTQPPYAIPVEPAFARAHPDFHRYCDTFGIAPLRDALAEKQRADNGLDVARDNILMTAGATNALSAIVHSLVDDGDDVLLLSPFWPFFRGMVTMAGGNPVEVPVYSVLYDHPATDVAALLEAALTPRTVAVYLNSPNNPSGKVLTRGQIAAVAAFARRHDLWLISDEAYDGMTFDGHEHVSPASLAGNADATIAVHTFSKVYMFAGLRLGYAVGSPDVIRVINKSMVHQLYSPSTLAQQMMLEPVRTRAAWSRGFVDACATMRDRVAERLRATAPVPDGAYYFFFSIAPYLNGRSYDMVIASLLDAGVAVAPGGDFGVDFADYIRICFAGESPERVLLGVDRLNAVLGGS
ncbi:MAG TPA: pyridoxal phosphate-dependent aminotransferase [Candidatus Krumholzibacteria bacterium]|nr:pyridoxal phosphate-dependent aminotransferase [Candidatus Krumholzibacteria bacterium]